MLCACNNYYDSHNRSPKQTIRTVATTSSSSEKRPITPHFFIYIYFFIVAVYFELVFKKKIHKKRKMFEIMIILACVIIVIIAAIKMKQCEQIKPPVLPISIDPVPSITPTPKHTRVSFMKHRKGIVVSG